MINLIVLYTKNRKNSMKEASILFGNSLEICYNDER